MYKHLIVILILLTAGKLLSQPVSERSRRSPDRIGEAEQDQLVNPGENNQFHQDRKKSLDYYGEILKKNPDLPEARFGAGVKTYEMEDYPRASQEFQSVIKSKNPFLKAKAYYNLGNTLYQQEKFEESAEAFKQALNLDPSDLDAKYNYELSRRMTDNVTQDQDQAKKEKSQQDSKQENKKDKNFSNQNDKQSPQPSQPPDKNQDTEEKENSEKPESKQLSEPETEAILNALKADTKNLMKRRLTITKPKQLEKDW